MNVATVRNEVAARLAGLVENAYSEFPANPVFPAATIKLPTVTTYHTDMAHSIARLETEVGVYVGRGDLNDAQLEIGKYISTDTPQSVLNALEATTPTPAWYRLKVTRTSELLSDSNSLGVLFFLEIDA